MKKSLCLILSVFMLLSSCLMPHMLILRNNTGEDVKVIATTHNGTRIECHPSKGETEYPVMAMEVSDIHVEQDGKLDHKYIFETADHWLYNIVEVKPSIFKIVCIAPHEAFEGSEKAYIESQGRFDRQMTKVMENMEVTIEAYDIPSLSTSNINGFPLLLRREGNQIIIYSQENTKWQKR